jgi:phage-related protein (TIGR01555 family)
VGLLSRLLRRQDSRPLAALARRDHWIQPSPGGRWVGPGGQGGITDRTAQTSWDPGYPVDQWLADALLSANPVARRIAAQEPDDATREGYDLVGLDPGVADAVEQACEGGEQGRGLGLLSVLAKARTWARAYGGGALVLLVDDGRPYDQPIDRSNIRAVRGVLDADRYELTVQQYGRDPQEPQTYGRPRLYRLNLNRGGGVGQVATVHADRVVRLGGVPLPRRLQLQRQGWDGSIFDQCFSALRNYGATLDQVAEAVSMLNQGTLTSEALAEGLETDQGPAIWDARMQALRRSAGLYNDIALGKGETYEVHNRSMAGLGEAVLALEDALIAAADGMPRLVVLGKLTAGFSNGSNGEMRAWYDTVAARQPRHYTPAVQAVVDLVMLSHEGPTGGQRLPYSVEWRPLWALSEIEQAQRDLARAQRRATDLVARVVDRPEVRREPSVVELYGPLDPDAPEEGPPGSEPIDTDAPLADAPDDGVMPEGVVSLVSTPPSTKPMPSDLLTEGQACEAARINVRRLRRLMRNGSLPYWDFGGEWKVSAADLAALGSSHHAAP